MPHDSVVGDLVHGREHRPASLVWFGLVRMRVSHRNIQQLPGGREGATTSRTYPNDSHSDAGSDSDSCQHGAPSFLSAPAHTAASVAAGPSRPGSRGGLSEAGLSERGGSEGPRAGGRTGSVSQGGNGPLLGEGARAAQYAASVAESHWPEELLQVRGMSSLLLRAGETLSEGVGCCPEWSLLLVGCFAQSCRYQVKVRV